MISFLAAFVPCGLVLRWFILRDSFVPCFVSPAISFALYHWKRYRWQRPLSRQSRLQRSHFLIHRCGLVRRGLVLSSRVLRDNTSTGSRQVLKRTRQAQCGNSKDRDARVEQRSKPEDKESWGGMERCGGWPPHITRGVVPVWPETTYVCEEILVAWALGLSSDQARSSRWLHRISIAPAISLVTAPPARFVGPSPRLVGRYPSAKLPFLYNLLIPTLSFFFSSFPFFLYLPWRSSGGSRIIGAQRNQSSLHSEDRFSVRCLRAFSAATIFDFVR